MNIKGCSALQLNKGFNSENFNSKLAHLKRKVPSWLWSIFRFVFLISLSFVVIYPILSALSIALRTAADIKDPSVVWIPKHFTLENFLSAIQGMDFLQAFKNSILLDIISSLLQVVSCAIVSYGFARFEFKCKSLLFTCAIITMIIPASTLFVPTYKLYFNFGMMDTVWAMYLPAFFGVGIKSGLFIYIFRQFYRNLPKELEEAALVDGCSYYKTFLSIILPSVRVAVITVFLFSLVWYWNDVTYSNMYFYDTKTIPMALSGLSNRLNIDYLADPVSMSVILQAGSICSIVPVLIVYIIFHRFFTEGIERSGIVG